MTNNMTNNMNNIIADLLHYVHIGLLIYIAIGWYITPIQYIHLYLIFIIFVILDWNDSDGICSITIYEDYFRSKNSIKKQTEQKEQKEESSPEFFRPLLNKLLNVNVTREDSKKITYIALMVVMLLGLLRLLYYYKIMKFPFYRLKKL